MERQFHNQPWEGLEKRIKVEGQGDYESSGESAYEGSDRDDSSDSSEGERAGNGIKKEEIEVTLNDQNIKKEN